MGKLSRGILAGTFIFLSIPFGIVFLLMLFTMFKNFNVSGTVHIKGMFDFIFVYIFLNFLISLLIGLALVFLKNIGNVLVKIQTGMVFFLLLYDIPPLKSTISDMHKGVPIGIPWTTILMVIHIILFLTLCKLSWKFSSEAKMKTVDTET
jgi:hypothetical protein